MKVGVVGCGYWGEKHVRVLASMPEVETVVAIDRDPAVLDRLTKAYPSVAVGHDFDEALRWLDAVVIATPPESHAALALRAIHADTHVFIEKPMTRSTAEADAIIAAAEERGVTVAVGHTFVHNSAVHKLIELVASGELGDLHHMSASRLNLGVYRDDVNVVWDLAAHDISIAIAIMGRAPDAVSVWGMRHTTEFAEDVACIRLSFEQEKVDSIIKVSWLDPMKVRTTTLVGSKKMVIYDDMAADEPIKILDRGREDSVGEGFASHLAYRYGDSYSPYIESREPLRVQAEDFVHACLTRSLPAATAFDGRDVVAVLEAADESLMRGGQAVAVSLFAEPVPARISC